MVFPRTSVDTNRHSVVNIVTMGTTSGTTPLRQGRSQTETKRTTTKVADIAVGARPV